MTVFSSGISMYAMGALLSLLLGWNIHASIVISAIIVLVYISLGGLTSAIYNEVLQFFMIVFGFAPLVYLGLREVGGWEGLRARIPETFAHSWTNLGSPSANPMGVEWFGLVMGLGFVLSFGYWCTDFLVVQRAMAADSMNAARRTPVIAALPKMIFPFLVIVPGIIALGLTLHPVNGTQPVLPLTSSGGYDYNMALPMMMARYYPEGMLGVGLTALMASFMSGMAGNVTAFNTVWTYDLYQSYLVPGRSDAHYLSVGRATTIVGTLAERGGGVPRDALQQHHGHAPADLQLRERTALRDVPAGHVLAAHHRARRVLGAGRRHACREPALRGDRRRPAADHSFRSRRVVHDYASDMAQNFWGAIWAWTVCFLVTLAVSLATAPEARRQLKGLVYGLTPHESDAGLPWHHRPGTLAVIVIVLLAGLNVIFW